MHTSEKVQNFFESQSLFKQQEYKRHVVSYIEVEIYNNNISYSGFLLRIFTLSSFKRETFQLQIVANPQRYFPSICHNTKRP